MGARRGRAYTGVVGLASVALAATAFTAPAQASSGGTGDAPAPSGHTATQQALEAIVRGGIPGVTGQAVTRDGVWKGTAGVGNLKTGAPRGAEDRFRIASITKTFVATVMLQLESEGRLDLDDRVEKWLPGVVRGHGHDGRKITVRQLLNHTSGVFDFINDPAYGRKYLEPGFLKHRFDTRTPQVAVAAAMANPPTSAPGTEYAYSNTNYVLAALIMEEATGSTYEHEVRERIIKPLKLRATVMPGNSSLMPKPSSRAYSKVTRDPAATRIYDVTLQNASQTWAEGDMISSAGDLNRFFGALMRGKLLSATQLKAMKTTPPNSDYGLGIERLTASCGTRVWGHGGGWIGSLSYAMTTEDGSHSFAFNLNGDWSSAGMGEAMEAEFCGPAADRPTAATTGKPAGIN
ncbi:serine hydrolase domain-containing protein [Streptomyces albipurpureus]|uniref:Beta-lactamase family protein n=1 Tax=Streptomyces albipurpureus TaxID=2897419 RepID=A0ABT0UF93_9ACTN|nr:serine hydrolase domain-containing protein [Streptomyces sp. CWNU-1]MCM2387282.1 beta-lactamase family protein [Streptomyces sp. CWNU-1]